MSKLSCFSPDFIWMDDKKFVIVNPVFSGVLFTRLSPGIYLLTRFTPGSCWSGWIRGPRFPSIRLTTVVRKFWSDIEPGSLHIEKGYCTSVPRVARSAALYTC